jgi:predicted DNA-binding transcriptional regulator AlpA
MELFTVAETAQKLRKSISSVYSDLTRRPQALPPVVRIPGSSKVLFKDVDEWLSSHVVVSVESNAEPKRRGRPTKAESQRKGGSK